MRTVKGKGTIADVIVMLFVVIFALIVLLGIQCRKVERTDHLANCFKVCYPKKVDEESSRVYCHCKEEADEGAKQSENEP